MIEVTEKKDYRLVTNEMRLEFAAVSDNEAFARMAVAAFIAPLNPTLEELSDVKTAVSEAVTNAIIHGYGNRGCVTDRVKMNCELKGSVLEVEIIDRGHGTAFYDQTRVGAIRDGVCLYGSFYGRSGGGFRTGSGNAGAHV